VKLTRALLALALWQAVAMFGTASASADSISIAVAPSGATGYQHVQVSLSGTAQPGDAFTVEAYRASESCPTRPRRRGLVDLEGAASFPYTTTVQAPDEKGGYRLCASLYEGESHYEGEGGGYGGSVIATAEGSLTVTATYLEAEEAASNQRRVEEEAKRRAEAEAAERKARYEAEAPARLAAEKAKAKAEAEQRAHETPLTRLSVSLETVHGKSSSYPGDTLIYVAVAAYAHVTIKLVHGKHHRTVHYEEVGTANGAPGPTLVIWSCSNAGGQYSYTVTARSDVGPTLTRRGHFKAVTVTRCAALRRQEQDARQRDIRKYEEEVKRTEREQRAAVEREEYNCRAEGGTPITLHTSEGNVPACRAPDGGLLPVSDLLAESATARAQKHKSRAAFSETQSSPRVRAANPIYFFRLAGVLQEPRVRPSEIVFAADGNWAVTGLHWRGWGPTSRALTAGATSTTASPTAHRARSRSCLHTSRSRLQGVTADVRCTAATASTTPSRPAPRPSEGAYDTGARGRMRPAATPPTMQTGATMERYCNAPTRRRGTSCRRQARWDISRGAPPRDLPIVPGYRV
jgi:putative hemolysin